MSIRSRALSIVASVVPSDYGTPKFNQILGGSYVEGPTSGTTCGFLTSYLLWALGCRDPRIVNRNDEPWGLQYHPGENISRLISGAKALGAWRPGAKGIRPGDIYFISNGPPASEHVGDYLGSPDPHHWETGDAGQRNDAGHQAARKRLRGFDGTNLETPNGWKPVVGYVDIEALPYAAGVDGNDVVLILALLAAVLLLSSEEQWHLL